MMRTMIMTVAVVAAPASAQVAGPQAVQAAMAASAAGWNAGDIDRFVDIYGKDAVFVTPKGLLRGKAEIAAHYRPSFAAGGNVRGKLTFQPLALRALSAVHQLLIARWTLTPAGPAGTAETGTTTLLFERQPAGWKIISDHSS